MRQIAKFQQNRPNGFEYIAIFPSFTMAAVRHLGVSDFEIFVDIVVECASPYQMSLKSVKWLQKYDI